MASISQKTAQSIYAAANREFIRYYLAYAHDRVLDMMALGAEYANFRTALSRCAEAGDWVAFTDLLESTRFAIQHFGYWNEYRQWLELILKHVQGVQQISQHAAYLTLLEDYATLLHTYGARQAAITHYRKTIQLAEQQQAFQVQAHARLGLGHVYFSSGQLAAAQAEWQQANALAVQAGIPSFSAVTNYLLAGPSENKASVIVELLDPDNIPQAKRWQTYITAQFRARQHFDRQALADAHADYLLACRLAEILGDQDGLALGQFHLGEIARMTNQSNQALRYYYQSEEIARRLNNHIGLASIYAGIAHVFISQEQYARARPYLEEAVHLERELGHEKALAERLLLLGYARANTGSLAQAAESFEEADKLFAHCAPEEATRARKALDRLDAVMGNEL